METLIHPLFELPCRQLSAALPWYLAEVTPDDWSRIVQMTQAHDGRLLALWGRTEGDALRVFAVVNVTENLLWLSLRTDTIKGYPDLVPTFPYANRMQRSLYDMLGIKANDARDQRPWLNHGKWPADYFPLQKKEQEKFDLPLQAYDFVAVQGDGVHEIAVGPIHAGIIEPGHFRFSVVGEKVLRLEQHLGYTHKGVEKLFTQLKVDQGYKLAGRISGDSTVAYSWAYCMAAEMACKSELPTRAVWLRALLLERERVANHLADLGALANDTGLAFGLAQFSALKEDCLRLNAKLFAHRLLMDCIVPGGVAIDLHADGNHQLFEQCEYLENRVSALQHFYEEHAGLQDRMIGSGRVSGALAKQLGLCGFAARASGLSADARKDQPVAPYESLQVHITTHATGDVAARVLQRFDEVFESLRLIRNILSSLPAGACLRPLPAADQGSAGLGWVEGWRGPVLVGLECDAARNILSCHCHDPSWQNWPVLEHAIMGNIVPDFPLINKSFNLSYSGVDL